MTSGKPMILYISQEISGTVAPASRAPATARAVRTCALPRASRRPRALSGPAPPDRAQHPALPSPHRPSRPPTPRVSLVGRSATTRPCRSTPPRSATDRTSPSLCERKITHGPGATAWRSVVNSVSLLLQCQDCRGFVATEHADVAAGRTEDLQPRLLAHAQRCDPLRRIDRQMVRRPPARGPRKVAQAVRPRG